MSNWARLALNTRLTHSFFSFPPSEHWGQVDVWFPSGLVGSAPCEAAQGFPDQGSSPWFLYLSGVQDGLAAAQFGTPTWRWSTFQGASGAGPPNFTEEAVHTIGYHVSPVVGGFAMDWYCDGVLVTHDPGPIPLVGAFNFIILGYLTALCCCNVGFYSNVKIGTSQGAGDIFSDDFSGGLTNWVVNSYYSQVPLLASIVEAPDVGFPQCATVTLSPLKGLPGDPIHISGSGFSPDSPLTAVWASENGYAPVEEFAGVTTDGSGNFATTIPAPVGTGSNVSAQQYPVYVYDANNVLGCTVFTGCGNRDADGITAGFNADLGEDTNLPNPIVAAGGTQAETNQQFIYDYVWFDGAHWILWEDPSVLNLRGTFPPPANHPLNATRISADGSSVTDYPIDTEYQWDFDGGDFNDPGFAQSRFCAATGGNVGSPVWSESVFFSGWDKPIYDAHFATDGDTLWVGLVTRETVQYPWLDNLDAVGVNPGAAAQFLPLSVWTAGFTSFPTNTGTGRTIYHTETDGPINIYQDRAFPVTDAGEKSTGYWAPPCAAIYSFDGGAFNRIGTIDAIYCPGGTESCGYSLSGLLGVPRLVNACERGYLYSRIALAASENNPGVLHAVWSEGGAWGRGGLAAADCTRLVWDGGPQNQSYRVNYTTWSPTAKLTDTDLATSHLDRTNWYYVWNDDDYPSEFQIGFTWPTEDEFVGLWAIELRNDNDAGDVLLFAGIPRMVNPSTGDYTPPPADPSGYSYIDNAPIYAHTLNVYNITGGTLDLVQSLDLSLFPNEAEASVSYPPTNNAIEPKASNIMNAGPYPFDPDNGNLLFSLGPSDPGFAISELWDDPTLGGTPVYQVHVPTAVWQPPSNSAPSIYPMRIFVRVPADMSAPFDFMDGLRAYGYTVIGVIAGQVSLEQFGGTPGRNQNPGGGRWFRDVNNIILPAPLGPAEFENGGSGLWFDKVCFNGWREFLEMETPGQYDNTLAANVGWAICPGFHYDADADSISVCGEVNGTHGSTHVWTITTIFLCRGCRNCRCGLGVHIARRA